MCHGHFCVWLLSPTLHHVFATHPRLSSRLRSMDTGCFQVWVTVHESCCECVCVRVSACECVYTYRSALIPFGSEMLRGVELLGQRRWGWGVRGCFTPSAAASAFPSSSSICVPTSLVPESPPFLVLFSSGCCQSFQQSHWTGCLVKRQCGVTCISVMTDDVQEFP